MSIDPRLGTTLGPYRFESVLGRGGMGVVYLALQENLQRRVALKVLAPELIREDEFRRRFLRETLTSGTLEHPNIVPVYDAGEIDDLLFIAMRYVAGSDLKDLIEKRGALDPQLALRILTEIGRALAAAHRVGLVHRDVKPANVLLALDGDDIEAVYLTDFGLTKHAKTASRITKTGYFLGTYFYAPPEQFKGGPVDHRSDIYSLGCVAFECLAGRVPFDRDSDAAMLHAHLMEPVPEPSSLRPALPKAVDAVIAKAMAKEPDERYESCGTFIAALGVALEGGATEAEGDRIADAATVVPGRPPLAPTVPPIDLNVPLETDEEVPARQEAPPAPAPPAPVDKRRLPVWVAAAGLAALVGVGAFVLTRDDDVGGAVTTQENIGGGDPTIGFTSDRDGDLDIFTMSPTGEGVTKLTDNEAKDGGPAWSPDGETISFSSTRSGGEFDIFVMIPDGSGQTNLTQSAAREVQPAWSPDGERIAFVSDRDGDMEVFTMRPDGSEVTQVTNNDFDDFEPSWSSDSSRISFASDRDGDFDVFSVDAAGGAETAITEGEPNQEDAMFSPAENLIAFSSDAGGDFEIVVLDLDADLATTITDNDVDDRDPSWSADGESLVFESDLEVAVMNADGSDVRVLTDNDGEDSRPALSP